MGTTESERIISELRAEIAQWQKDYAENEAQRSHLANELIPQLEQWISDLQSGMYVNCVYCGHRYGPKDSVPTTMADALKKHVEQCLKHPMSALRSQLADLQTTLNMRWDADQRAIARWKAEKPAERDLTWPDHVDLVVWLAEENDRIRGTARLQAEVFVYEPRLTCSVWQDYGGVRDEETGEDVPRTESEMIEDLKQGVRDGEWVGWRLHRIEREVIGIVDAETT